MRAIQAVTTPAKESNFTLRPIDTKRKLREVLSSNLEFHEESSNQSTHDLHAFPAKFPPQLPRFFINSLTLETEKVLDPMMGSGTTLVEAVTAEREATGFDIDPLAVLISTVKTTSLSSNSLVQIGHEIVSEAKLTLSNGRSHLSDLLTSEFDGETQEFLDYWFAPETQVELMALKCEINKLRDIAIRKFFELALSAIIITKSGGVSLAWDLAHTRPHKLKQGVAKTPRPALADFVKRVVRNAGSLSSFTTSKQKAVVDLGNAESLPMQSETVDLIFTSPPYASNAIDYMRASKFALVWLGYTISELKRLQQIASEVKAFEPLEWKGFPVRLSK